MKGEKIAEQFKRRCKKQAKKYQQFSPEGEHSEFVAADHRQPGHGEGLGGITFRTKHSVSTDIPVLNIQSLVILQYEIFSQ
jgi:hypothetical protein